jgi:hypothetical protein
MKKITIKDLVQAFNASTEVNIRKILDDASAWKKYNDILDAKGDKSTGTSRRAFLINKLIVQGLNY